MWYVIVMFDNSFAVYPFKLLRDAKTCCDNAEDKSNYVAAFIYNPRGELVEGDYKTDE